MGKHNHTNYHCMMCDMVYYGKERLWLPKNTFNELELYKLGNKKVMASSGIFHYDCLERYLEDNIKQILPSDQYRLFVMEQFTTLDKRLEELKIMRFRE